MVMERWRPGGQNKENCCFGQEEDKNHQEVIYYVSRFLLQSPVHLKYSDSNDH